MGISGTCRYASLNAHSGCQQSRRDDLESLGFMFIYLQKGSLPWQGLHQEQKEEKFEKVLEKKKTITIESLCDGCPVQFQEYLNYVRNLRFEEKPDYAYLKKLFVDLAEKNRFNPQDNFDWEELAITD